MIRRLRDLLELSDGRQTRLLPMEGLRGVAVIMVFLQHYAVQALILVDLQDMSLAVARFLRGFGNMGVTLFFILSGYLIYGTLLRRAPAFLPFMARRVQRIYPAFLCVFAPLAALHWLLATGEVPHEAGAAARVLIANLLLLPGVVAIQPILQVAWTLSFEIGFYLAIGLLVPGLGLRQWPRGARVALILAMAGGITGLSISHPAGIGPLGPLLPMLPFFAGMLLLELGETRLPAMPGWPALAVLGLAIALDHRLVAWPMTREWMETVALALVCSAAFQGGNAAARAFSWTPLRWLGNMSYSYYLLHGLVVVAVFRGLAWWGGYGWPTPLAWLLVLPLFAASVVASLVLFALVERPFSLRPGRPVRAAVASA